MTDGGSHRVVGGFRKIHFTECEADALEHAFGGIRQGVVEVENECAAGPQVAAAGSWIHGLPDEILARPVRTAEMTRAIPARSFCTATSLHCTLAPKMD